MHQRPLQGLFVMLQHKSYTSHATSQYNAGSTGTLIQAI